MLKVGDKVKFKSVKHLFGIDNGKVIEINAENMTSTLIYKIELYKIELKLGGNFIHDTIYTYKLRNELYKIVTIFAGIF